ncbi:hypothetical protein PEBR_28093 [Penicillium brasilianum]|uniref:Mid2 domain-containing protein n=1 Tax=Penicillium brasilianum TaxID=104259 RepID=A0A1S9RVX5_PENBI|nr:hypothetical protein PEBR_28093 [Penicillium brasilianum]
MVASLFLLLPLYLAYIPSATAWVFSWTNSSGGFLTDHGDGVQSCKAIDNPKGNIFDWDAKGGNFCIYLYNNGNCSNSSAGYTCKAWPWSNHVAGSYIHSYEIVLNNTDTASTTSSSASSISTTLSSTTSSSTQTSATAASTSAASNTSSPTTTPIAASTDNNTAKSSSISGGAIAGIVVGVLAAVAIAGILFFFLCWRPRKKTRPSTVSERPVAPMSELGSYDDKPSSPTLSSPTSNGQGSDVYQGQKLRELPGSGVATEIGPGVMRAELAGSTHWKN